MIQKSGIRFSEKIMPQQNNIDETNSAKLDWSLEETMP
jgi:hypothetical protein